MYVKKVLKIEEEAPTIAKQTCKLRYAEEEKKSKEKKQAGESQNEEKKKKIQRSLELAKCETELQIMA